MIEPVTDEILDLSASSTNPRHSRILIWRSEVATAVVPPPSESSVTPSAPSLTTATTSSTSSSISQSARAALSRGRNFISRISRKMSKSKRRHSTHEITDFMLMPPQKNEPVRTSMYFMLRPEDEEQLGEDGLGVDEEIVPGEDSEPNGNGNALRATQARLKRASWLLAHGDWRQLLKDQPGQF